jgi:hypothetical protein
MSDEQFSSQPLPIGRIEGRMAFEEVVRLSIEQAAVQNWNHLCWMDSDFSDWPLGERRVYDALQAWSRKGRRMVIMAKNYDRVIANHHRFVNWRRQWAHIIECWQCPQATETEFPSAILTPAWSMQRSDPERYISHATLDGAQLLGLDELRQYWIERSSRGFPAHVLGL